MISNQAAPSAGPTEKNDAHRRSAEPCEENQSPESVASGAGGEGEDVDDTKPGLPFSKARCIALVVTLTGASLLNVCTGIAQSGTYEHALTSSHRLFQVNRSSSFYPRLAMT